MDISVCVSDYFNSVVVQIFGSLIIIYGCILFIMLRSIQFYNQLCFRTIEIGNITTYYFLFCKSNAVGLSIRFEVIVPQVFFLFRHVLSQLFC